MSKTLVSGIKPTGRVHLGNYFGMFKQIIDLQEKFDNSFVFLADLHALTSNFDAEKMRGYSKELAISLLSAGVDPKKTHLFRQSDVPEVAELAWIFDCITTMPYLMRAHAFKDAEAKNKEINVGVFNYPMLMAADILIYGANAVPVGKDQKQHVEITRDTAEKFNRLVNKEVFVLPEPLILEETETVLGTDGQKMSKSYNNVISLFFTDEEIKQAVMSIPTDSKGVEEAKDTDSVLFKTHSLFLDEKERNELKDKYQKGGMGYKEAKDMLISEIIKFLEPIRQRKAEFEKDENMVEDILLAGAKVAREKAQQTISLVRESLGFRKL